jgi:voltage-gated potassium channel Kch
VSTARRPLKKRWGEFMHDPPTMRAAAGVIVTVTALVVVASGALIRVLDHQEFSSIWLGMWWALQTVTTVGYGDIVPKHLSGRIVGAVVMLQGVAFVTVFTALITSIFVARAAREREVDDQAKEEVELRHVFERLGSIEQMIDTLVRGENTAPED